MEVRGGAATGRGGALYVDISKRRVQAERSFDLHMACQVPAGITILFGPSGAGKTTLLDCLAGLETPDTGRIVLGESVFFEAGHGINLPVQDRRVGYVFQDLALFPHLSVEKNVEYGLAKQEGAERRERSGVLLEAFGIAHLRQRRPREISGGERQRVALARALVTNPCLLLLDEPLAALDAATKSKIVEDLRRWNQTHGVPILYVTHSREEVFALGERVLVLDGGRVLAQGTPHEVMTAPRIETVAQLAGFENVFEARVAAIHADRGTMTCQLAGGPEIETPLVRGEKGAALRVGIRAGDILLATELPRGLSARNLLPGKMLAVTQRDVIVEAKVDCGVPFVVHLTLAARDSLQLQPGREVWLVIKTHSCHLMAR
jgi:molybdate transport system ATP-binding protein